MKKTIAILAILALLVLISGCAQKEVQKTAADNTANQIDNEVGLIDEIMDSDMSDLETLDNELAELDELEFE